MFFFFHQDLCCLRLNTWGSTGVKLNSIQESDDNSFHWPASIPPTDAHCFQVILYLTRPIIIVLCSSLSHAKAINPENQRINPHPFNFWCLHILYTPFMCATQLLVIYVHIAYISEWYLCIFFERGKLHSSCVHTSTGVTVVRRKRSIHYIFQKKETERRSRESSVMSGESYMESDFYNDSAYTQDISTKMRVPDRLTAHGGVPGMYRKQKNPWSQQCWYNNWIS